VKVFAIAAVIVIALLIVLLVFGQGGRHGPGRHISGGDTPSANARSVTHADA
jgi:preprotein translocase subunit SecG